MKYPLNAETGLARTLLVTIAWATLLPVTALAQVPVDENGEAIGEYSVDASSPESAAQPTGNEDIPLLSTVDLEELVGPIALYPDDLLAIVLPASAYPLQIVDAARFLEALENDPSLKPDPEWDDSVVALVNYPEVIELLNDDIDWTWRLGEAVVSQQADVVTAIETFRDRAYAAGNLKSDSYQSVTHDEGIIEIVPIADDVIYVPYYEPERVVVYQPRPVYYYYPRPRPVYYYPYSSTYAFDRGYFWGVTTAFSIGWFSDSLNVYHHSYRGHPYYGHSYWNRWWYRRPTMSVHNTTYVGSNTNVTINSYYSGDRWQPRANRRDYISDRRDARSRYYPSSRSDAATPRVQRSNRVQTRDRVRNEPVTFRARPQTTARTTREPAVNHSRTRPETTRQPRERVQPSQRQHRADRPRQHSEPASRPRRTEPVVQARRVEPQQRARRPEPQRRASSRAEPQRETNRAAPQRQERVARRSSERSSQRASDRKSEQRSGRGNKRTESKSR